MCVRFVVLFVLSLLFACSFVFVVSFGVLFVCFVVVV